MGNLASSNATQYLCNQISAQDDIQKIAAQVQDTLIPVGFVYTQLSSQKDPHELWPTMTWDDITKEYAGLFFRAEGGSSAPFGERQQDNAPVLTEIQTGIVKEKVATDVHTKLGDWSDLIYVATSGGGDHKTLRFKMTEGEVRPKNEAVIIWKRVA
ncbi:unnamed protein product [Oppiella nova]|uniref:Uncharacterized protein n=1 Tax=Oppiella nova TaxID=334625 RepID=A0A7R9M7W6_9ACAR|nr:unnamed protein product [Oppiella nova]CAG2171898.1 unnamed protein product [Oppiella nova]